MMNATIARDPDKACRLLTEHLSRTARIVLDSGICDPPA